MTGTTARALRAARAARPSCARSTSARYELLLHVREGCCLYYRTPAALKCFSCPLLDDDARRRLVAGGG